MQDAIDIKVFQTLGMARGTLSHTRVACEGPRPTVKGDDFLFVTVARGPSDAIRASERVSPAISRPLQKTPAAPTVVCCSARCMARDRPSPYGESGTQAWRGTGPRPT